MNWRFTILDRNNAATVIDEPPGWDKNSSEIKRDLTTHAVFFTNEGDELEYYGLAMHLLKAEHEQYGFEGTMLLVMEEDCGNGYEEFSRGRFDFNKYEFYCGDSCYVKIPVENSGEIIELLNRFNQKVDLEALIAFDQVTALPVYDKLPFILDLPSKGVFLQDKAETKNFSVTAVSFDELPPNGIEYDTNLAGNWNSGWFQIVPAFDNILYDELGRFTPGSSPEHKFIKSGFYPVGLDTTLETVVDGSSATPPDTRRIYFDWLTSPLLVNDGTDTRGNIFSQISCDIDYSFEMTLLNAYVVALYNVVVIRKADGTFQYLHRDRFLAPVFGGGPGGLNSGSIWHPGTTNTVNFSSSDPAVVLQNGEYLFSVVCGLALYINNDARDGLDAYSIRSLTGHVNINSLTKTPTTTSHVFMINEAISRISESITNNKLKAYSEYFGRTDSQPYALDADGCGSMEVITDGIRVRRQENKIPGTTNLFSVSLQDIFDGLSPIYNIGMGIEPDTNRPGFNRLRVEPWHYFYNDEIIMSCTDVGQITRKTYDKEAFSTFQFGYAKWEAEEYNGLDEFLTKRTGRTTLSQIKNDLVKLSKWVASGYALEVTRRKGDDNTKDWRYDKDTFIICCKRGEGSDIVVELGNVLDPENIIDPDTIYNYRISPIRNGMRWMNKIFESYRQFGGDCKLIFTDGDGNYFAKGQMQSADCKLENGPVRENQTIDTSIYEDADDAKPFLRPERVLYDYPMSTGDIRIIKQNPYGLIYFSNDCEEGVGYIDTINYIPEEGRASFNLIPKVL